MKKYLLSRATSLPAWIGALLFVLEIVLHMGNVSTLMLVLAALLVVLPEEAIQRRRKEWEEQLRGWADGE